eukprot:8849885-Pyramimonas_sp.AAC.1
MDIAVLCLQETHCKGSPVFDVEGFCVILSGKEEDAREYAGVGFIVAPWAKQAIKGYMQQSSRMASLRIRVAGGVLTLITTYAWTNVHEYDTRRDYYTDLAVFADKCRSHGPTIILGDFNARLLEQYAGEEDVIGEHVFRNPFSAWSPTSNRELLVELCHTLDACVANTYFKHADEHTVTYHDIGIEPSSAIVSGNFEQLDHIIVAKNWMRCIYDIWSSRDHHLQSHHFIKV